MAKWARPDGPARQPGWKGMGQATNFSPSAHVSPARQARWPVGPARGPKRASPRPVRQKQVDRGGHCAAHTHFLLFLIFCYSLALFPIPTARTPPPPHHQTTKRGSSSFSPRESSSFSFSPLLRHTHTERRFSTTTHSRRRLSLPRQTPIPFLSPPQYFPKPNSPVAVLPRPSFTRSHRRRFSTTTRSRRRLSPPRQTPIPFSPRRSAFETLTPLSPWVSPNFNFVVHPSIFPQSFNFQLCLSWCYRFLRIWPLNFHVCERLKRRQSPFGCYTVGEFLILM